jgi:glycosyltransferase involved in cell wall biosynthesis
VRILFLTENFPPETNAAATRVHERAVYWRRWGHEVTVLTCTPNFPQGKVFPGYRNLWRQREDIDGIDVLRLKTYIAANEGFARRTLDFLSFMAHAYVAGLGERRPDVVVATSPQFFAAVGGWALAATRRLPFVFELGDLWPRSIVAVAAMRPSPAIRAIEQLELFLYRRSAAVVALTDTFKTDLVRRGIAPGKIAVIRNGVDLPRYAPRPRDEALAAEWGLSGRFVLGYVGTHGMAHDLGNVLAAAELLRSDQRIAFLFVGAGAEREMLIRRATERRLTNVVFQPMQPKERMPAIWSLCDVALVHLKDSPAFAEVIPSKMFEAMGMGLPLLLVSPDGEASRILAADGAGLWVPAGEPESLAAAATRLAGDEALRRGLAAASLATAPLHTRERQAALFMKALEAVAAGDGEMVADRLQSAQ